MCSVTDCDNKVKARDLCSAHYERLRKYGDVSTTSHGKPVMERISTIGFDITERECWEWRGAKSHGYGVLRVNRRNELVHRLMYLHHKGEIGEGLLIRHSCDNPPCVNPQHLLTGTVLDNARDAQTRGRTPRGESHWNSILTYARVADIRDRVENGESQTKLAEEYGVVVSAINGIVKHRTWVN